MYKERELPLTSAEFKQFQSNFLFSLSIMRNNEIYWRQKYLNYVKDFKIESLQYKLLLNNFSELNDKYKELQIKYNQLDRKSRPLYYFKNYLSNLMIKLKRKFK